MPIFTTFKRWTLKEDAHEIEVVALIHEKIIPAYMELRGCLKLEFMRIQGTDTYITTQHWESCEAHDQAWMAPEIARWQEAYQPVLAQWYQMMTFEEEWETEGVIVAPLDHH